MPVPQVTQDAASDASSQSALAEPKLQPPAAELPRPLVGPPSYPPNPPGLYAPPRRHYSAWAWLLGGTLGFLVIGAIIIALLGGLLFWTLIKVTNSVELTRTTTQIFSVSGPVSLTVQNTTGYIKVLAGPDGKITADVTKRVRDASQAAAQRDLDEMPVSLTQNGNTLSVDARTTWNTNPNRQLSAELVLMVPATTAVHLEQTTGDVVVIGTVGVLFVQLTTGSVGTQGVTMMADSQARVTTGALNIDGELLSGASLNASVITGTARFMFPAATATHLEASVTTGTIVISGWQIPVTQHTPGASASGNLNANPTSTLTIQVTTGEIQLKPR